MDLNKEAEELYPYVERTEFIYTENDRLFFMRNAHINAINNSKATKVKVIQAQIDVLFNLKLGINDANTVTVFEIQNKIKELQQLEQQLNKLENE